MTYALPLEKGFSSSASHTSEAVGTAASSGLDWWMILIIIVVILAIFAAVYWFYFKK